jgi:hypothetical protein
MKTLLFPLFAFFSILCAGSTDYLDNHSCKECHEAIYDEFQQSAHAQSYFSDELHRKIAEKADPEHYDCAPCHMPAAKNLADLVSGSAKPDSRDVRQSDGVSCFFCHTIAYVKKAHDFNRNLPARQAKGYKPSLFGSLVNPDESDKHSSLKSPIYMDMACKGCHSHKVNENNVTIFRAMHESDNSRGCIRCHMPKVPGGVEKMDKRGRGEHRLHSFPGIRDPEFRKSGYALSVEKGDDGIVVTLTNKMPHPMIIQPARARYLEIVVKRHGKVIWRNFKKSPEEDEQSYFAYRFYRDGKRVPLPNHATSRTGNNLAGKEIRRIEYRIPDLRSGDEVTVTLYAILAKGECSRVVNLEDKEYTKPLKILSTTWKVP